MDAESQRPAHTSPLRLLANISRYHTENAHRA